jgi:hypothetical protein
MRIVFFWRAVIRVFLAIIVAKVRHPEPTAPLDAVTLTGAGDDRAPIGP